MKPLPILSLILMLLFIAASRALAVQVYISVKDTCDEQNSTTGTIHNGLQSATAAWTGVGHLEGEPYSVPDGGVDEEGNPTYQTVIPILERWTTYTATVPPEWLGKSVCFSVDGTQWSALHLLQADPASLEFRAEQVGASPFAGTATDPASSFSDLGNTLLLGRWWNDAEKPVFTATAWDNACPGWPCAGMDLVSSAPNMYWRWIQYPGYIAMELDYLHRLTLRKRGAEALETNGPRIVLDPQLGRITINDSAVLTTASASTQYVAKTSGGVNLALGGGLVTTGAGRPPQIVLGSYNDISVAPPFDHSEGVLIVGSGRPAAAGESGPVRKNGLRILDDGTVLILPKGDLEMDFTEGPTP
jgi:hypothetical protein